MLQQRFDFYSAPDRGAEFCDERVCVCVCVCVSVCVYLFVRDHIFGTTRPIFIMLPVAVAARFFSGDLVVRYVLSVLWMTSYLLISQGYSSSPPS